MCTVSGTASLGEMSLPSFDAASTQAFLEAMLAANPNLARLIYGNQVPDSAGKPAASDTAKRQSKLLSKAASEGGASTSSTSAKFDKPSTPPSRTPSLKSSAASQLSSPAVEVNTNILTILTGLQVSMENRLLNIEKQLTYLSSLQTPIKHVKLLGARLFAQSFLFYLTFSTNYYYTKFFFFFVFLSNPTQQEM